MGNKIICGKSLEEWICHNPLLKKIINTETTLWSNPKYDKFENAINSISLSMEDVVDCEQRLKRFAPFIVKHFPETKKLNGIIESPLIKIPSMQKYISELYNTNLPGHMLLKCDNLLSIAGSIKARGGIYEVLKHTEDLALKNNLITLDDDYSKLAHKKYIDFFNKYTIQVGSTGNLGLSIGIMSAKIGFNVIVHMSKDAKQWKKDLLRSKGVTVIEYKSDYNKAVKKGRALSNNDPTSYFIDDENSINLFLGYSAAAIRLKKQLDEMNIVIDENHPLFVYLPCGVGGGPGGVAFGLKLLFKDNVHCFFAEPTHSPCMLLGMLTEQHNKICVQDFGIDNITEADGLAVGRPSGFVGKTFKNLLSGIYTIQDDELYVLLSSLIDTEKIRLEPSACAGIVGPWEIFKNKTGLSYLESHNLIDKMNNAIHISWATGGQLVPEEIMNEYYNIGKNFSKLS
ncbi:D-serine ammonia-lyase [Haloimpatiens sp. FM7330]|uniref:D-serine ammonia-lyase n=1 Tax=Haloimpatiens sp. FM7330 TaxID=3298610 RepID=UPI00363B33EC